MKTRKRIKLFGDYGILYLGSHEFLFDSEDYDLIRNRDWYRDKDGYLVNCYYFNGRRNFTRFHRIIMNAKPKQFVDHINRNRADNRKQNLRVCNYNENNQNRGIYSTNKSGVPGVYFDKERMKWVATITHNRQRIYIGRYKKKQEAIAARRQKELDLYYAHSG